MKKHRELYIDGIKGLACFFIMLGHYCGIYKYAQNSELITCGFLKILTGFPISIITTEGLWLYLFFVVSGYLISLSMREKRIKIIDVIKKSIIRFFRLAVPILSTAIIVLIIQNLIGFYNQSLEMIVENNWMTAFYNTNLTIYNALLEPVRVLLQGESLFNSPFWCLKEMFLASILIYFFNYINQYICKLGGGYSIPYNSCIYNIYFSRKGYVFLFIRNADLLE